MRAVAAAVVAAFMHSPLCIPHFFSCWFDLV